RSSERKRARLRRDAPSSERSDRAERSGLVELADQRQREARAHVLEVRAHLQAAAVPAGLALDVLDRDLRGAQRLARAHAGSGVLHVDDVLLDPVVELALEVRALLPRPDLLALEHLQV